MNVKNNKIETPWPILGRATITDTSLLGYVSIRFAHLDPDIFAHSFWQN